MKKDNIKIEIISSEHSKVLSVMLGNSSKEYTKYFIPFSFDEKSINKILSNAVKDKYFGIFIGNELVGFYMLRGFDEGYEIPSYGVWISENYSGLGLSKFTLQHAISYCKLNEIKKIMLKVHPDNLIAKRIYEDFGFIIQGVDEKNKNLIYYKSL